MAAHCKATGRSSERIRHHGYYLGPAQTPADVRNWIQARRLNEKYDIETGATSAQIAQHLANGHVIGRCCGRMEFGQRSLGNRSIIADPRNPQMIDKINRQIKNRDFWMPFAPSMLTERAHKYVVNPKQIKSPAMTIGFDSTDEGKRLLGATLHPADRSLRPQLLERAHNPDYYALIEAFEQQTGVASVLNTSFNLHGEPIVCTPDDALHVLESSDIDMIAVEDVLVKKRPGQISA
jgi:carbamoyltransferase